MRSDPRGLHHAFTRLEIAVVVVILFLIVLAVLPAFRKGDGEQHHRLHPRPTLPTTRVPESPGTPATTDEPSPTTPKPSLR